MAFVAILVFAVIFWLILTYNRLQSSMQEIRESYANLQASLKKREQLSGQLIDIASKYMEHEQITQIKARGDMRELRFLVQNFPELRANETFQKLMGQLEGVENDILVRRRTYNSRVKDYNSSRGSFPTILIASRLSFEAVEYYNIDDAKFDSQAAEKFTRDDTEALQKMIASGIQNASEAAGKAAESIKKASQKVGQESKKIYQERAAGKDSDKSGGGAQ